MTDPNAAARLLIGDSPVMRHLRDVICRVAPTPLTVLIRGPRGAGKELVAQALHTASARSGAFVAFNACAIADAMFEDALFGHVRGAFTGASGDSAGYLTEAHRGTVFLDEVSGVSPGNQRKLLRAIETRQFRPVGGRVDRESDFRLIAASNDDLPALVATGAFRADLADRLAVFTIHVPPLTDHISDVPRLADHFLKQAGGTPGVTLSSAAMRMLMTYDWPGNVRQLRHAMARLIVYVANGVAQPADIARALDDAIPRASSAPEALRDDFQRRRLLDVLDQVDWNVDRAAKALGVARTTIYRRLRRFGFNLQFARPTTQPAAPDRSPPSNRRPATPMR